ncbi:PREDICTED: hemerythrin subunit A-like [Priapulus caudatus]|uniref:Hemerythrin subunit A-like n=1 Tax=Priapulus caudatus TaxID=37621 RepID=A0ABM1EPB4_PRICU|nr:PREDICTED: hemerythrin subunit A-like [Priapulus caudatus]
MATYAVPEPYRWDTSFMVFYERLDDEHKGLFQSLFAIGTNHGSKAALKKCQDLMASHFHYEQVSHDRANYAGFKEHKSFHDGFLAHLPSCPPRCPTRKYSTGKNWLVQHIKNVDFAYRGKL